MSLGAGLLLLLLVVVAGGEGGAEGQVFAMIREPAVRVPLVGGAR